MRDSHLRGVAATTQDQQKTAFFCGILAMMHLTLESTIGSHEKAPGSFAKRANLALDQ